MTVEPRVVPVSCWFGGCRAVDLPLSTDILRPSKRGRKELQWAKRAAIKDAPPGKTGLPLELYAASPLKPAVLDACRESRGLGLYEKMVLTKGSDASYAWVNYDVDVVHLVNDDERYEWYSACGDKIRRLKLHVDIGDEYWSRSQSLALPVFSNLAECFVVSVCNIGMFRDKCSPAGYFRCPPHTQRFIDENTGEEKTYAQFLAMTDDEFGRWYRKDE